jgi:hypothetical protein
MEKSPLKNTLYNRAETLARKQFLSYTAKNYREDNHVSCAFQKNEQLFYARNCRL